MTTSDKHKKVVKNYKSYEFLSENNNNIYILIDNAKTVSTLDTPMNRSSSSLSNSSGKCSVETHPFSLQEEDVTKFQNAGMFSISA